MFTRTLLTGIAAAASICAVSAADLYVPKAAADFDKANIFTVKNGVFTAKGPFTATSKKVFKVDPAKKYRVSGTVKGISGKTGYIYLGFVPYNAQNRWIHPASANCGANTFTELAAPVKKGDKVIKVKDASKWDSKTPYGAVAFDAKADFSDLPNFNFVFVPKNSIAKKGDVWEITLKTPLAKAYPAGTKIRQQLSSSTYIYAVIRKVADKELQLAGTVSGLYKNKIGFGKFWPGTKTFRLLVMHGSTKPDAVLEIKNLKLEEVK